MQESLISILTTFKNTEQFLAECIESIINQTYTNWELIIVDDNSTDNSRNIVESFANKDKRIKLFSNNGDGIIDALRFAYKQSKGEYITRMDSDDIMHPEKLEVLLKKLTTYGRKHVALGLVKYFRSDGINEGYYKYEKWLNEITKNGTNYSEIYKECVIPSPCWMIHRDDLDTCDAYKPDLYPEDYDLTFRMYKNKIKCIPCNKILHYWRDYDSRTSRTSHHYTQNYFLDIKIKYFLELEYDSSRPLTVWGAGFKGKTIAKYLVNNEIPFTWICDNPNKLGKNIYGQKMHHFDSLNQLKHPQSIVTVANEDAQKEIKSYFKEHNLHAMDDYFFFC